MPESDDPSVVHTVVVHADDVVTAYEARVRGGEPAVLRITPPFSGRMRARIHLAGEGEYDDCDRPAPIHLAPDRLVEEGLPDYPHPDDTEDRLREREDVPYSPERHHEAHGERVAVWREVVRGAVRETLALDGEDGDHEVRVAVLG